MRRYVLALCCVVCGWFAQAQQVTSLPQGARIVVDTMTTDITVISPSVVRVTKYLGSEPELAVPKFMPEKDALADSLPRTEEAGKLKINTGRYYAAVNAKDGNVSFWNHDGTLILAEQHKSASLAPTDEEGLYAAKQDFQIGKSKAESIYCPAVRENLKGKRTKFGDDAAPLPLVATELGYSIYWNTPGFGYIDDSPGRVVKKPGDVTFSAPETTAIDYYFILKSE